MITMIISLSGVTSSSVSTFHPLEDMFDDFLFTKFQTSDTDLFGPHWILVEYEFEAS